MNSPESRTPSGDIVDQGAAPTESAVAETVSVPETYTFTAPEGVTLDPAILAEVSPIFKDLGLSQDSAQKLVDFYQKQTSNIQSDLAKNVDKTRSDWRDQVRADPTIGSKLTSHVLPEIGRAFDKLPAEVSKSFREALDFTGAGDHPSVVRALYEWSKLVSEGTHISGNAPSPHGQTANGQVSKPSIAASLYPNLPH